MRSVEWNEEAGCNLFIYRVPQHQMGSPFTKHRNQLLEREVIIPIPVDFNKELLEHSPRRCFVTQAQRLPAAPLTVDTRPCSDLLLPLGPAKEPVN